MPDNKEPKADFSDVEGGSSSTAPPVARTHTVVKGDTLSKLAKQYYGGGRTLDAGKLKAAFAPLLEQGQGLIGRYGAEIADRARTIDVRNLPALIKTV